MTFHPDEEICTKIANAGHPAYTERTPGLPCPKCQREVMEAEEPLCADCFFAEMEINLRHGHGAVVDVPAPPSTPTAKGEA